MLQLECCYGSSGIPQAWHTMQLQVFLAFPLCLLALRPRRPDFQRRLALASIAAFVISVAERVSGLCYSCVAPPIVLQQAFMTCGQPAMLHRIAQWIYHDSTGSIPSPLQI